MAKEDMDLFLDALKNEKSLSEEFAKAVADTARNNGFEVDEQDVLNHFLGDDEPSTRPLPDDGHRMTTMALGEEGGRGATGGIGEDPFRGKPAPSVTLAIGEEDKPKRPPSSGSGTGVTTMAVGEEGKGPRPPRRGVTTAAIGEESKKPRP